MKQATVAVILFPGTNCEEETKRALEAAGIKADIVRWNQPQTLKKYDGYVLPGGWSYEDRIRAGAVAAKDPIMDLIREEAKKKKPVLGICNGCQVLIETGIIPELKPNMVEMAIAPNINPKVNGFYCVWTRLKTESKCAFTKNLEEDEVIAVPIAHAEGRFATIDKDLLSQLNENNQVVFRYCDEYGEVVNEFPINPNGSLSNIAGICNKYGNVLAMMPHPERASWQRQSPFKETKPFNEQEKLAPASKIFSSMKTYIDDKRAWE